jgi:hypothetical protein
MVIRTATLDDAKSISALFQKQITRWQRISPQGYAEDVTPDQLSIYQRWLHGGLHTGAWMSLETSAIWLSHLLRGAGLPWLLTDDAGIPQAYAELFVHRDENDQPHLHMAHLIASSEASEAYETLMQYILEQADKYRSFTASCSAYDDQSVAFYQRYGLQEKVAIQQISLAALTGQAFYKATPAPNTASNTIQGWRMPLGEHESPRFHWEYLWHNLWAGIPQMSERRVHHLHLNASGQEAYICYQQHLYDPRATDVYCWTPKPFSSQLLASIRDWAHREGYRTLTMFVKPNITKILGENIEVLPQKQVIYERLSQI